MGSQGFEPCSTGNEKSHFVSDLGPWQFTWKKMVIVRESSPRWPEFRCWGGIFEVIPHGTIYFPQFPRHPFFSCQIPATILADDLKTKIPITPSFAVDLSPRFPSTESEYVSRGTCSEHFGQFLWGCCHFLIVNDSVTRLHSILSISSGRYTCPTCQYLESFGGKLG